MSNKLNHNQHESADGYRTPRQLVTTIFVNNSVASERPHLSPQTPSPSPPLTTIATKTTASSTNTSASASKYLNDDSNTMDHATNVALSRFNSSSSLSSSLASFSSDSPFTQPEMDLTSVNQERSLREDLAPQSTFILANNSTDNKHTLRLKSPTNTISSAFVGKHKKNHNRDHTVKNHNHMTMSTEKQNHHHVMVVHGPNQMNSMSSKILVEPFGSKKMRSSHSFASSTHSNKLSGALDGQRQPPIVSEYASVLIRDLHYEVGRGRHKKTILDNINLTVPEGSIYGLLGPSGCGKTTMLRCTVGRLKPKKGSLLVFGYKPNDNECQIPGRAVGYMPQEISVYEDFTIEETLKYFGKINRMKTSHIKQRIEFLLSFLDLPTNKRLVANLSGGQKRRVSLAAALVHSPPLLILDEPTVGVDPLLRQSIWEHLVTLTQTERISVIITTHYIEEARRANVVGFMRHGKILAENSPQQLMATYKLNSLERVFLKLCVTDSSRRAASLANTQQPLQAITNMTLSTLDIDSELVTNHQRQHHQRKGRKGTELSAMAETKSNYKQTSDHIMTFTNDALIRSDDELETSATILTAMQQETVHQRAQLMTDQYSTGAQVMKWASRRADSSFERGQQQKVNPFNENNTDGALTQWCKTLMAVTWKNFVRLKRNPPVLIFQFIVPAIQVILFCSCIGGEPFDVPVAIVNDEVIPQSSQLFLNGLDRKIVRQVKYSNLTTAVEAVKMGKAWGVIHIPDRYSQNLQSRLILGDEVTNDTISNGTIRVYPDLTNLHLALALEKTLRETFISFARDSLENLGYDRSLADLPIQVARPIYGNMKKDGYLEFMAPGVVISISYVMATGLTALAFILERRDGLLERSLVSGVQTSQILLAHAINQVVVMTVQIFLVLACTFFVFEIPSRGPFVWVVLLILLQGCTGMAFGLLVSAVCEEENTAVMMLVGTFYTNLILAGIIWPIEAVPHWLRPLSYAQPQTLPTETLRHILSRGWGIEEPGVQAGFVVTIGWLVAFLLAAGMIFKYSK